MPGVIQPTGQIIGEEGTSLTRRPTLNFIGALVTAADNSASNRTDITITGDGTGSGGSVPAALTRWFDVTQSPYNAAANATALGVGTDDTAAVQAAIDAASAVNGTVYIPGRCKITSSLTVSQSITICGPGAAPDSQGTSSGGTLGAIGYIPQGQIIKTFSNGDAITVTGNHSTVGVHIYDLGITSSVDGKNHTAGAGIRLTNTVSSFVERCTVFNQYDGIVVDGSSTSWATRIRDCEIALIRNSGVKTSKTLSTQNGDFNVSGCQITNGANAQGDYGRGAALDINGAAGAWFHDLDMPGWLNGVRLSNSEFTFFSQVACDTCVRCWFIDGARGANRQTLMTNCYALGGGYALVNPYGLYGVQAWKVHVGGPSVGVLWQGGHVNSITNSFFTGGYTGSSIGVYVEGPTTPANPGTGPTYVKFVGLNNTHGGDAFYLGDYASKFSITDCFGSGAVTFAGNHKNCRVENNDGYTVTGDNSTYTNGRISGNLDWTA